MPSSLGDLVRAWRRKAESITFLESLILPSPFQEILQGREGEAKVWLQAATELETALKGQDG